MQVNLANLEIADFKLHWDSPVLLNHNSLLAQLKAAMPESKLQVCHVEGGGVKPGWTTECVQQGLVQQHRFHRIHLQVTDIHFKHLFNDDEDESNFFFRYLKALEKI